MNAMVRTTKPTRRPTTWDESQECAMPATCSARVKQIKDPSAKVMPKKSRCESFSLNGTSSLGRIVLWDLKNRKIITPETPPNAGKGGS